MTFEEVIQYLEENGDPRALKAWKKMGLKTTDRYLGNGLTKLKNFAKKVGKNHELALKLWQCGIHDAKILACFIEEPKKVTDVQIDQQIQQIQFFDVSDRLMLEVVSKTNFAQQKMELWTQSDNEYTKRSGFALITGLVARLKDLPDEYWYKYIKQIEQELQKERNWVKEMMNYALIAIGNRNTNLNNLAVKAANTIGLVEVDYGETSCKTIDTKAALKKVKL